MREITIFCRKCGKSMRIDYPITGNDESMVMNGVIIRCHTHKCSRAITLKNVTERMLKANTDIFGKCYL